MKAKTRKRTTVRGKALDKHFKAFEAAMKAAAKTSPHAKKLLVRLNGFKAAFVVPFFGRR